MIPGTWVNRKGRYPYVSRETWWTRYHLLGRKIARQSGSFTSHDRRIAGILASSAPQGSDATAAVASLDWILYGNH